MESDVHTVALVDGPSERRASRPPNVLRRWEEFINKRLSVISRLLMVLAVVLIGLSFLLPLWHIHLWAPQYPEGLDLWIYGHRLEAGNEGQDLVEINILNHYIGMQPVEEADFREMDVIPFALGFFIIFGLRTAVVGYMTNAIDHVVLFGYFSLYALSTFLYRLYSYGHDLDPRAPINPDPFWPAIIGTKQIANMTQTSLPGGASYLLVGSLLAALLAIVFSRRQPVLYATRMGAPA
jgi:copper chaperone NosL